MEVKLEKRGKLPITGTLIKQLLHLPKNVAIVGADYDANQDLINIHLKGTNSKLFIVAEGGVNPSISFHNMNTKTTRQKKKTKSKHKDEYCDDDTTRRTIKIM